MYELRELLDGCHREDTRSQRILFELYRARLMGLCRRYCSNRDEAKDVLQESFIKIFRKISHVTQPHKLDAWMKSVVVNTAIDHFRSRKLIQTCELDDVTTPDVTVDPGINIDDEVLIALIEQLPDGCRVIFNLFVVEGYTHSEIATALKISEGTSRSQLNYAKTILKNKLKCHDVAQYYARFA